MKSLLTSGLAFFIGAVAIVGSIIGIVFALCLTIYAILAIFSWFFSDPLDLVATPNPPPAQQESQDVIRCREQGGYPIKSLWDNRLKECKFY